LGDAPVLAVQAGKVASCRGYGKGPAGWQEMIQWLFFNGIDMNGTWISIGNGIQLAVFVDPVPAIT
jgi:hypothetical protein